MRRRRRAPPAAVMRKTEGGGIYGAGGCERLGEGATEAAAASWRSRTPAASWGGRRARAGRPAFGWASAQSDVARFFFK